MINDIYIFNLLIFDFYEKKNKISLRTKFKLNLYNFIFINDITFGINYLLISKEKSISIFNANNMKEIFPKINNLNLNKDDEIINLMNFNDQFLLIATDNYLIKYDFYKRKVLYYTKFFYSLDSWIFTTKNYFFIYEDNSLIIFDKKTIKPIQSKRISDILFIDEIDEGIIKVTTTCNYIIYDKFHKKKIYLFAFIRISIILLYLYCLIGQIEIILDGKYKILLYKLYFDSLVDIKNLKLMFYYSFYDLETIKIIIYKYIPHNLKDFFYYYLNYI